MSCKAQQFLILDRPLYIKGEEWKQFYCKIKSINFDIVYDYDFDYCTIMQISFALLQNGLKIYNFNLAHIILIDMEKQAIEKTYFKEYQCCQFKFSQNIAPPPHMDFHILFREVGNQSIEALPSVLIDKFVGKQMLYLLNWKAQYDYFILYMKELSDQRWKCIKINILPQIACISGGIVYMISGRQILLLSLNERYQDFRSIQEGKIIAVDPCMVEYQNKGIQYQPGVSIVFWNKNLGYFYRHYSIHYKAESEQKLTTVVNRILFKTYTQFHHFEVIIPNLIALVFRSYSQFYLFNMQTGEIQESTRTRLIASKFNGGQRPLIKWKQHKKDKNYNKSLIITIGVNSNIEIFFIHFKYLPHFQHKLIEYNQKISLNDLSLEDISNENYIDWSGTKIIPYITLAISGNIILDLAISKKGIIYYSKNQLNSQISNCNYIDLNIIFLQSPVLTQEASIWRRYFEDQTFDSFTDGNRFFIPNRYPIPLVQYTYSQKNDQLQQNLLNNWRTNYAFKNIIIFNEEIIIVRRGSLNLFRAVQEELYLQQYFSDQTMTILDKENINTQKYKQIQQLFIKNDSQFQDPIYYCQKDRPILKERIYKVIKQQDLSQRQQIQKRASTKFKKLLKQLKKVTTQDPTNFYLTINIKQFIVPLVCNQLSDCISYYNLIMNQTSFRLTSDQVRQFSKQYEMHCCNINYISYFYELNQRSEQQYKALGNNLITLFIREHQDLLTTDIDANIYKLLKLLLENLLILKTANYQSSQIQVEDKDYIKVYSNSYIQFLVDQLIQYEDSNSPVKSEIIRSQFSSILKIGFLDQKSIYFSKLWKNASLFKALLLSNNQQQLSDYFCQFLLKQFTTQFVRIYTKLKRYILPGHKVIIQNQLFFNQNIHGLDPAILLLVNDYTNSLAKDVLISRDNSQLGTYPQKIAKMRREIYTRNILSKGQQNELQTHEILTEIQKLISSKELQGEYFRTLKERLDSIQFVNDENSLIFYEEVIKKLVELFNSKYKIQGWPQKYSIDTLASKKDELRMYLNSIGRHIQLYKNHYNKVYEEKNLLDNNGEIEENMTQVERQYNIEMILFKQRFITDSEKLYFFENQRNLICCSISIDLIKQALNPHNNFFFSLQETDNLICFWMNQLIKNKKTHSSYQTTHYLEMIYLFDRELVKDYLSRNGSAMEQLQRIYTNIKNEANYQFFELFKEEVQI